MNSVRTDLAITVDAQDIIGLGKRDPVENRLPVAAPPRHGVTEDRESFLEFNDQFLSTIGTAIFADDVNVMQALDLAEGNIPFGDYPLK